MPAGTLAAPCAGLRAVAAVFVTALGKFPAAIRLRLRPAGRLAAAPHGHSWPSIYSALETLNAPGSSTLS